MTFIKLQFAPGINRDQTNYSSEGSWFSCDKVRFRSGFPEKLGGWEKYTPNTFSGVCRQMFNWSNTLAENFLALGTHNKVYIEYGGFFNNITPFTAALAGPNTFNSTNTSATISVTTTDPLPSWVSTGDDVLIAGFAAPFAGIAIAELNRAHTITVTGANSFTFESNTTASATDTVSSASLTVRPEISPGDPIAISGLGWGAGTWGRDAWGLGSLSGGISFSQRDWWFDNFDNDLVMNIRNGAPYWWERGTNVDPKVPLVVHAISLQEYATKEGFDANAVPVKVTQMLVSQQDSHLIAFGAVPFGSTNEADFDPMLIRWADQSTPADWTPTSTNTAGDIRVSRGSRIVRALPSRQEVLVWTDAALFGLQFLGNTNVFGLQEYADNISIISPRAIASASNVVYWMGRDKFYAYSGRVDTIPCTLRSHVFQNINKDQIDQVVCGTNEEWNEIWWFYPTADSVSNNAYVVFNYLERIWYYGSMNRTAWLDSALRQFPFAANTPVTAVGTSVTVGAGAIYNHESGVDDDGAPMDSFIESSYFDVEDGDRFMLARRIIPDVTFRGSDAATPEVTLRISPKDFPGAGVYVDPADTQRVIEVTADQYTNQVFLRARARHMALKIMSSGLGVQWQLGTPRIDVRPDGRR